MAYLAPSDLPTLALSGGRSAELDTLDLLRRALSSDYTVFHGVHWSRDWRSIAVFGEADFIVVNNAGAALVIEQKSGGLEDTAEGLFKIYDVKRKDVARQIHRTLDAIRDKFRWQHKDDIGLDYLLYCPDHRLRSLNAVGLERSHVVDASDDMAERIRHLLPPAARTAAGERVHRFFEQTFDLVPDIHAHVKASERSLTRASGGLADTLACVEMRPLRLRVFGTAGCGKSTVAGRFFAAAGEAGKRPLLVCFNRPLAERLKATTGKHGMVETWYGLMSRFLESRGHTLDFDAMKTDPNFWNDVQEKVIAEPVPDDWRFDTLIVDEGQDFEPEWYDILRMFITDDADVLWLEDSDQAIRKTTAGVFAGNDFIGYRARKNYRSPDSIARFLRRTLPFEFEPANPLPGLGYGVTPYADAADQPKLIALVISDLLKQGFRHSDIVILSLRGLKSATLANRQRVGNVTLSRFTGNYDMLGNQVFEKGQVRFDTAYRFKGQQSPAVILTDVDPDERNMDHALRLIFSGATRATLRLDMLVRGDNPAVRGFLQ